MSDAGITIAVGRPGAGKSYYAVRLIVMALLRGQPVATNVPMREGWQDRVARMRGGALRGREWRRRRAAQLDRLLVAIERPEELVAIGVPGCGRCASCRRGRACSREGRALAVLDEAPDWLDARQWNLAADGEEGGKPILRRARIIRFFRKHRKRGWSIVLITQDEALLDNQVRGNGERYLVLRNLRRLPHWSNLAWYLRIDVFSAVTYWGVPGRRGTVRARAEWFLLNRRIASLYDTMGGFADDGSDELTVWPWGGGARPAAPAEAEAPELARAADADAADDDQEHQTNARAGSTS